MLEFTKMQENQILYHTIYILTPMWKSQDLVLKEKSCQLSWKRFAGCNIALSIQLGVHQFNHIQVKCEKRPLFEKYSTVGSYGVHQL